MYAIKGYERIKEGKTVQGRSVDWYGDYGRSASELISKSQLKHRLETINYSTERNDINHRDDTAEGEINSTLEALQGAWLWVINEPMRDEIQKNAYGNFIFIREPDSKELKGVTIIEQIVSNKEGVVTDNGIARRVDMFRLTDFKSTTKGQVSFEYSDK